MNMSPVNVAIYILHSKELKERDASVNNIRDRLSKYKYDNLVIKDIHVVYDHDPNEIPIQEIQKIVNYTQIQDQKLAFMNQFIHNIHIQQLSCTLKHQEALKRVVANNKCDYGLILEDDVLFSDQVCKQIDDVFKEMSPSHPIVFLGLPNSEEPSRDLIIPVDKARFPLIPLTEAYIVQRDCASKMLTEFLPITFSTNLQINYVLGKCDIQCFQSKNNVFVNGSKYGLFVSSCNANNVLLFNKDYMTINELLNKDVLTPSDCTYIENTIKNTPIAQHPDFVYLIAKYKVKKQEYKEAEKLFEQAYNVLLMNKAIVNHESAVLKDFIRLYKHLQQ